MKDIFFTADGKGAIIGMHILYAELLRNTNLCTPELNKLLEEEINLFLSYSAERSIELPEYVYEF